MSGRGPRWISVNRGPLFGDLDVGASVMLNLGGVAREFLAVQQGVPSDIYDSSCDGTWLMMKDCYVNHVWHTTNVNDYANSAIHTYLNNDLLALFDAEVQALIKQVKIPYRPGSGSSLVSSYGENGLSAKIFLISGRECNFTSSDFPTNEGSTLAYFSGTATAGTDTKRIAYLNGSAVEWFFRSPYTRGSTAVAVGKTTGTYGSRNASTSYGIRPLLIMPSTAIVSSDMLAA